MYIKTTFYHWCFTELINTASPVHKDGEENEKGNYIIYIIKTMLVSFIIKDMFLWTPPAAKATVASKVPRKQFEYYWSRVNV